MMDLKEARKQDKLDEFVKEHNKDPKGDSDKLDKALESISHSQNQKSIQETSDSDSSDD